MKRSKWIGVIAVFLLASVLVWFVSVQIEVRTRNGELIEALQLRHRPEFIEALRRGASANARDGTGSPVLMLAARCKDTSFTKALLDHGADVNATDDHFGLTALMEAASSGNVAVVQLLLSRGPDVNVRGSGRTALKCAQRDRPEHSSRSQQKAYEEILEMLKQAGAKE